MPDATPRLDRVRSAIANQRQRLLSLVRRRTDRPADAEDIVQTAIERALCRSDQLRDDTRVDGWLARIARNATIDQLRQSHMTPLTLEDSEIPFWEEPAIDCWCVLAQVATLKPEYAQLLERVDIQNIPVNVVARELGITANNAMVRLHRARGALRKRMAEHCGTTSARSCSECGCDERGCCFPP